MPDEELTSSRIKRLGERFRKGDPSEEDLLELERYRLSFDPALDHVLSLLQTLTGLKLVEPDAVEAETLSARRGKTTESIVQKLRRERTRLPTMQDIAGARIVVRDLSRQEEVLRQVQSLTIFKKSQDLRASPHHGYRAIHVILEIDNRLVELQIRTWPQHFWADFSEAVSRAYGSDLKYGGGPENLRQGLMDFSDLVAQWDAEGLSREDLVKAIGPVVALVLAAGLIAAAKGGTLLAVQPPERTEGIEET